MHISFKVALKVKPFRKYLYVDGKMQSTYYDLDLYVCKYYVAISTTNIGTYQLSEADAKYHCIHMWKKYNDEI